MSILSRRLPACRLGGLRTPTPTLLPYTTLFRSRSADAVVDAGAERDRRGAVGAGDVERVRVGEHRVIVVRRAEDELHDRAGGNRSEEHTSELQSPDHLVCRLLLENKKMIARTHR